MVQHKQRPQQTHFHLALAKPNNRNFRRKDAVFVFRAMGKWLVLLPYNKKDNVFDVKKKSTSPDA